RNGRPKRVTRTSLSIAGTYSPAMQALARAIWAEVRTGWLAAIVVTGTLAGLTLLTVQLTRDTPSYSRSDGGLLGMVSLVAWLAVARLVRTSSARPVVVS